MNNFNLGGSHISKGEFIQMLLRISIVSVISFYSVKWMINQIDPTSKNKKKAKHRAEEQLKRLNDEGTFKINTQLLNDYELMIASHIVVPSDISVSWCDVAGLDSVVQELRDSVVLPVRHRYLFCHTKLWQAPRGVLLHGPPGCGKTLIAKATAKEAGMRFINLDVSILTDKWYGESQKLASAVFSLALKIEPCIIFIDEIDSFLRSRNSNDHEATAMMKTQFMMLWDGLNTNSNATVIVMGATNRPQDLDKAILRRMPTQFYVGLPSADQRLQILQLILKAEVVHELVDFNHLAKITNGFSGSDLRELCRNASVLRMRQLMCLNESKKSDSNMEEQDSINNDKLENNRIFAITMENLLKSYEKVKESKIYTGQFLTENGIELD